MRTTEPNGPLPTAKHPAARAATPYGFRWEPEKSPMPNTQIGIADSYDPAQRARLHCQVVK